MVIYEGQENEAKFHGKPPVVSKGEDIVRANTVKKRYADIKKLSGNPRKHRGLELTNGLRVLLVSNPSSVFCSASMQVHVGCIADPDDIPGMAHLCEHLLVQGSRKYPKDNEIMSFVQCNGGILRASTGSEWTSYHFEIVCKHFMDALDRFIHSFISPLFDEKSIECEVEAVDSEFRNYVKDDVRRMARIHRVLSRPGHDIRRFNVGNRQTLLHIPKSNGLRIRDEVVKFFEKHYSSNVMSLCVSGPQSLDELEDLVLSLPLLEIPNRNVTPKVFEQHYYGPEEMCCRVDVINVEIYLSKEGLDHVEDVVELLFLFIGVLRRSEPHQKPLNTKRSIPKSDFAARVSSFSETLRHCPLEDVAIKESTFSALSIQAVLDQLTPRNMICFVVAKENSDLENLQREQYYGIEYRKTKLHSAFAERLERALETGSELFWMPEQNEFLVKKADSELQSSEEDVKKKKRAKPQLLTSNHFKRIWYLESLRADRPFTEINACLTLPRVASDARSQVMAQLFTRCFEYQTREEFYDAEMVGFEASVEPRCRGLKLAFSDFDDSICQTVGDYMRRLISFEPEKKVFDVVLDALKHTLINVDMEQPHTQGDYLLDYVLTEGSWPNWQLLEASERVTFEDLVEFVPTLWSALHLELFARGTLAKDEVLRLCSEFLPENDSRVRPLSSDELAPPRELMIPAGVSYFYEHKQAIHSNSCVVFYLQVEPGVRNYVLLKLLVLMMKEPVFYTLRTKERLGYYIVTTCRMSKITNGNGLCITVQGPYDPNYVESRIEAFLESFKSTLVEMSESDFKEYWRKLRADSNEYWYEIETRQYLFERFQLMGSECRKVEKSDLLHFYVEQIMANSEKRQKVSIRMCSTTGYEERFGTQKSGTIEIEDLDQFKHESPSYDCTECDFGLLSLKTFLWHFFSN
ncbi:hypothetical protein QR680_002437 [Steinernema hermaphroditum]|uniref:Peptidase M16 N-terminal domain-containing protein n=1 Tax=Steinernema hermaphroditum TaxID=289476 RepID=A0AA39H4V4_9BILA|nr:hypothetical protein QR680_002437 [Steinernema hermaphroditum]